MTFDGDVCCVVVPVRAHLHKTRLKTTGKANVELSSVSRSVLFTCKNPPTRHDPIHQAAPLPPRIRLQSLEQAKRYTNWSRVSNLSTTPIQAHYTEVKTPLNVVPLSSKSE